MCVIAKPELNYAVNFKWSLHKWQPLGCRSKGPFSRRQLPVPSSETLILHALFSSAGGERQPMVVRIWFWWCSTIPFLTYLLETETFRRKMRWMLRLIAAPVPLVPRWFTTAWGAFACSGLLRNLLSSRARPKSAIQKSIFHFRSRSATNSIQTEFRDRN